MCVALTRLLKSHGYNVKPFESGDNFLKTVRVDRPDCMLLDLHMPRKTGFDVLESMFSMRLGVPIIVITGHDELAMPSVYAGSEPRTTCSNLSTNLS